MDLLSAASGLASAYRLITDISAAKTDAEVKAKTIELTNLLIESQKSVLSAQTDYESLVRVKRDLEEKITKINNWNEEKKYYLLHEFPIGSFAYILNPNMGSPEPEHYICTTCYEDSVKSILQTYHDGNIKRMKCHKCGLDIETEYVPLKWI